MYEQQLLDKPASKTRCEGSGVAEGSVLEGKTFAAVVVMV